jgi:RNase adaptor protein for sRNA GlmZ degradation
MQCCTVQQHTLQWSEAPALVQVRFTLRSRPQDKYFDSPATLTLNVIQFNDPTADRSLCMHSGENNTIQGRLQQHASWLGFLTLTHAQIRGTVQAASVAGVSWAEAHITIDVVCRHGKHRSVAVAGIVAALLMGTGHNVELRHWRRNLCCCGECRTGAALVSDGALEQWVALGPLG